MSNFKVGEVCISQNLAIDTDYNGMECVIDNYLPEGFYLNANLGGAPVFGDFYEITYSNGVMAVVRPKNLRRKQPPQELTEWAASKVKEVTKPVQVPEFA